MKIQLWLFFLLGAFILGGCQKNDKVTPPPSDKPTGKQIANYSCTPFQDGTELSPAIALFENDNDFYVLPKYEKLKLVHDQFAEKVYSSPSYEVRLMMDNGFRWTIKIRDTQYYSNCQ